jgi:hypothetical protein
MDTWLIPLISAVLAPALLYVGVWTGYWMARNAADKPVRSLLNPPRSPARRRPIEEPEGDPYVEAMTPPSDEGRVPTLPDERR